MMTCNIIFPESKKVYSKIESIILPTHSGEMQILPQHAESFILLTKGSLILKQLHQPKIEIDIPGGECHFKDNIVIIIL